MIVLCNGALVGYIFINQYRCVNFLTNSSIIFTQPGMINIFNQQLDGSYSYMWLVKILTKLVKNFNICFNSVRPGSRAHSRALEAFMIFDSLSCYICSLISKHSDTKWNIKNIVDQILWGSLLRPPLNPPLLKLCGSSWE